MEAHLKMVCKLCFDPTSFFFVVVLQHVRPSQEDVEEEAGVRREGGGDKMRGKEGMEWIKKGKGDWYIL